jgi:ubiquinone/menaquinone biosynthesis C-methylase UbiE
MNAMVIVWIAVAVVAAFLLVGVAWRWASRVWSLPCPTLLAWTLETRLSQRISRTTATLQRMGLRPGQKVLEMGPGPGRLLIPAARLVLPGGEVVGIDIQPGMVARLQQRAKEAGLTNLIAVLGDASLPIVPEASFDVVFLVTVLGEIPDRAAALAQAYRALRPGGVLSITETMTDPHYQSRSTVKQLAEAAGFRLTSIHGGWWMFTANFEKPDR